MTPSANGPWRLGGLFAASACLCRPSQATLPEKATLTTTAIANDAGADCDRGGVAFRYAPSGPLRRRKSPASPLGDGARRPPLLFFRVAAMASESPIQDAANGELLPACEDGADSGDREQA